MKAKARLTDAPGRWYTLTIAQAVLYASGNIRVFDGVI